ncbi:asparagine synthase (glutamine-hydrolyzing) [Brevibacillus ginsengisoli]|uniref:asparagine synthase (glutamine-hydrolyzing) n=1 Tax=Brevibacillus ginsengisoli TaxID=363854 RepID=UPI003CF204D6
MCGIAGIVSHHENSLYPLLYRAQKIQAHRGPDGQGIGQYQVGAWQIGLGHQRLAILDLSESGAQPMIAQGEKGVLIYNGEVYNYREIRDELVSKGYRFHGDSDTEVILCALHHWGIDDTLPRLNGMWAFAWLDQVHQQLYLSRDRFGVKPLYYAYDKGQLLFASEIKTIRELTDQHFSLNHAAVGAYIHQTLLGASDDTFFHEIHKVAPSHYLRFDLACDTLLQPKQKSYWQFPSPNVLDEPYDEQELSSQLRELFIDSVRLRLRSDVPVGVLLSGGVDSSAIATVMNQVISQQDHLHMLSAVSPDPRFDESPFIDQMSSFLNRPVQKVVLDFNAAQAFDYLHQVTWHNDEPIGSFSTVAHYLLMEQAKHLGITVILSGQGADELLCGYRKYLGFYLQELWRKRMYKEAHHLLYAFWKQGTVLHQFNYSEAKRYLPAFLRAKEHDISGEALHSYQPMNVGLSSGMSLLERQQLDITRYSVPVLTHYEDRMSMAFSREVRLPFLDYRLVEKLLPLSPSYKLKNGWTKYIFRQAMQPLLPAQIVWRKDKQGFVNPQSEWLKGELRSEVLRYFEKESLIFQHHLIDRGQLQRKYDQYCAQPVGKGTIWFKDIFAPLALEVWLRQFYS